MKVRFFLYGALLSLFITSHNPLISEEGDASSSHQTSAITPSEPTIQWYTSLQSAKEVAQTNKLPIYLLFTGPSWCVWCQHLEKDIQTKSDFINRTYNKFIFVTVDIPRDPSSTDPDIRDLMVQYKVYGVPVIVILSPEMQELGRLSYQNIAPKSFAELALNIAYPPQQ